MADSTQVVDLQDKLLEAIEIVSQATVDSISYDKTLICTITDNTDAKEGKYKVTDGSITFTAYSTVTNYTTNTTVYVTIPNGDFNNQKIIIGKKTSDTTEPFVFNTPFDTVLDLTGNLITIQDAGGLTANGVERTTQTIYEKTFDIENEIYTGFERLGIQGQFKAWVSNAVTGDYGLKVTILARNTEDIDYKEANQVKEYIFYLKSSDMYGDPYNFESYYSQEKVFDISDIGTLYYLKVEFYEVPGTFKDKYGNQIPYLEEDSEIELWSNLFCKDIYICAGFDLGADDTDRVYLYTFDSTTYSATGDSSVKTSNIEITDANSLDDYYESIDSSQQKTVYLRWVHLDENQDGFVVGQDETEDKENNLFYEIRWYRYNYGAPSGDQYCGVYWDYDEEASGITDLTTNYYDKEKELEASWASNIELVKQSFEEGYFKTEEAYQEALDEVNKTYTEAIAECQEAQLWKPASFSYTFIPDFTKQEEKIKAIIFNRSTGEILKTDIVTFTNTEEVRSYETLYADSALSIYCVDKSYGNYRIYGLNNQLLDSNQSKIVRTLEAHFDLNGYENTSVSSSGTLLTDAEKIVWRFPASNTMLIPEEGETIGDQIVITHYANSDGTIDPYCYYTINSYYNANLTNNIIECSVTKDRLVYNTQKEFTFGQAGTSGTDVTLIIDFDNSENGLTLLSENGVWVQKNAVTLTARLYNSDNEEQDLSGCEVAWSWYNPNPEVAGLREPNSSSNTSSSSSLSGTGMSQVEISFANGKISFDNLLILQCSVDGWGDVELISYLPVPLKLYQKPIVDENGVTQQYCYYYITGATQVIYLSSGDSPQYYKGPYILKTYKTSDRTSETIDSADVKWKLITTDTDNLQYYPTLKDYLTETTSTETKTDNLKYLSALRTYVEDLQLYGVQACSAADETIVYWTQPILQIQNNYFSTTINNWDGQLDVNKDGNYVLAATIGAGKKNTNNTFSGVILGEWAIGKSSDEQVDSSFSGTGLWGFHEGAASFGFSEDGTAFIGKSGRGRIELDGDNGTIYSSSYRDGAAGMKIDLDDGIIDVVGKKVNSKRSEIKINCVSPYFKIDSNKGNTLMYVADNNYFLQSNDYVTDATGMRINLDQGSITAYDFTLSANNIRLSSSSPYFTIQGNSNCLINIGKGNYYLQSDNYSASDGTGMYINLSSGYIKIGNNFSVTSTGALTAKSASFTGDIQTGSTMTSSTISGGTISGTDIKGANIYAGNIYSYSGFATGVIGLTGYFTIHNPIKTGNPVVEGSRFGFIQMDTGDESQDQDTEGLGMWIYRNTGQKIDSAVKVTDANSGLKYYYKNNYDKNNYGGFLSITKSEAALSHSTNVQLVYNDNIDTAMTITADGAFLKHDKEIFLNSAGTLQLTRDETGGIFIVQSGDEDTVPSGDEDTAIVINVPVYFKGPVTFEGSVSGIDTSSSSTETTSS